MNKETIKFWGLFLLLTLCSATVLSACSNNANATEQDSITTTDGKVAEIVERGTLLVGTTGDYRPLSFRESDGSYWGFGIEIAKEIANELGVKTEFVQTSWPTLTADVLKEPQIFDLAIGGITITDARRETMLMSEGYLANGKTILCRASEADRFRSLADIDKPEVRVMVNPGGLNEKFANANLTHAQIIVHQKNEEIPSLIAEGKADVMITEITEAPYYVQTDTRLAAPLLNEPFTHGEIGVLMQKGQEDLLQMVNSKIEKMKADGTLRRLHEKYGLVYGYHEYSGVPLIILDTDIGSSADDLFALEMLYRYEQEGRCKLLGVVVDREGEDCAAVADVMNTYFGHADTPIGLVKKGIPAPAVWIDYKALPTYTTADGQPMFLSSISDYSALPDGWQLYRRLLAQQPDHSVSICTTGFVTALAQLLQSEADEYSPLDGVELVRQKVKCIYMQGGVFGTAVEPDFNFGQGITFAQDFFRLWPQDVDMVFSPGEVGDGIEYTPEQVIGDISWTDLHPIKQVYLTCNCNTGQMMWDPMPVIQAVEGDGVFSLSGRGTVVITPNAETIFTASSSGNCRYQVPGSAAWNAAMLQKIRYYNQLR